MTRYTITVDTMGSFAESAAGEGNANLTAFWGGLSAAIADNATFLEGRALASAAQYEAYALRMADIAADYANGLTNMAEGVGTSAERAAMSEVAETISTSLDNMRASGSASLAPDRRLIHQTRSFAIRKMIGEVPAAQGVRALRGKQGGGE